MDQATLLRASAIVEWAAFVLFPLGLFALWLASRRMPAVESQVLTTLELDFSRCGVEPGEARADLGGPRP